jgi:predicted TIM-barrel fold metal-dependent hydrolase
MPENIYAGPRVIAVEEHVWTEGLRAALLTFGGDETVATFSNQPRTNELLLDVAEERLARMDAAGVDLQVLSVTAPGVQQLPAAIGVPLATEANDFLAEAVQRRPDRFAAFATLPTQAPGVAAQELHRCISELGFVGAMLFPRTGADFLDHERFRPIFEAAASLKVPLYIHPGLPPAEVRRSCYEGFEPLTGLMLSTGGWGWHAEAGLAALRLILAGTFDRHPDLQMILGHWGEMLVAFADRADALTKTTHLQRRVVEYITNNVYATAGGVFSHRMLRQCLDVLGPDRLMFAVDDPFNSTLGQNTGEAVARSYIGTAPLTDEEKDKLAYRNAERFLAAPFRMKANS